MGFILLLSSDPLISKVTKDNLPQQALMELFTEGISNRGLLWGLEYQSQSYVDCVVGCIWWDKYLMESDEEAFVGDIAAWRGLDFNDADEIVKIQWVSIGLTGPVSVQWLPSTVSDLVIESNSLSSTIDLTALPHCMKSMNAGFNRFSGAVDLEKLPFLLHLLALNSNAFSGTVNLKKLPSSMTALYLDNNNFVGEIALSSLPENIMEVFLHNNYFEGETDFSQIPGNIKALVLSNNPNLSGIIRQFAADRYICADNTKIVFQPHEI